MIVSGVMDPLSSRAKLSPHHLRLLDFPATLAANSCAVAAFLAMANRWQCCLCHARELKDPTVGQVSYPPLWVNVSY